MCQRYYECDGQEGSGMELYNIAVNGGRRESEDDDIFCHYNLDLPPIIVHYVH